MKQMCISKLQYISPQWTGGAFASDLQAIIYGGIDWVQVRVKGLPFGQWVDIASQAVNICKKNDVVCLVNDDPRVARESGAGGVHLGKNDMSPREARKLLGGNAIIGGTANTFDDIEWLTGQGVDYVGLGPFRFTTTKANLSPILGLEGYRDIMARCKSAGICTPVVAIGGILPGDVAGIMATGVHGVAVSGVITNAVDKKEIITSLKRHLR